jgi:hypothetical protein
MQYKTVAGPGNLIISRNGNYEEAVKQYASLIDSNAVGGWELDCIQQIPVTKRAGCLAGLFGKEDITVYFNMLVFRKNN